MGSFAYPTASFAHPGKDSVTQSHRMSSSPFWAEGLAITPGSYVALQHNTPAERQVDKLITPRLKPVPGLEAPSMHRQRDYFIAKAEGSSPSWSESQCSLELPLQLRQDSQDIPIPIVESIFQSHLTRMAGDNSWKLCNPLVLQSREGQPEPIVCKTKPVAVISQETWGAGCSELRQKTKSFTSLKAAFSTAPEQEI